MEAVQIEFLWIVEWHSIGCYYVVMDVFKGWCVGVNFGTKLDIDVGGELKRNII